MKILSNKTYEELKSIADDYLQLRTVVNELTYSKYRNCENGEFKDCEYYRIDPASFNSVILYYVDEYLKLKAERKQVHLSIELKGVDKALDSLECIKEKLDNLKIKCTVEESDIKMSQSGTENRAAAANINEVLNNMVANIPTPEFPYSIYHPALGMIEVTAANYDEVTKTINEWERTNKK